MKSWDKSKKKAKDAKGVKGGEFIYQMQFLCKDVSTQSNNNVYRILLYTHEGLGSNFFTIKPNNDDKTKTRLTSIVGTLTRFNSWVDAVVERRNGYYFIKDTKFIY